MSLNMFEHVETQVQQILSDICHATRLQHGLFIDVMRQCCLVFLGLKTCPYPLGKLLHNFASRTSFVGMKKMI